MDRISGEKSFYLLLCLKADNDILNHLFFCHRLLPLSLFTSTVFLQIQWGTPLVVICPSVHPAVLWSLLSKMRSVEYTSRSQPDFMVPVVTHEPVVLHCRWCQFLIWHIVSPACWDGQWCTGLLWNKKLTFTIAHSLALHFMGKYQRIHKKGWVGSSLRCFWFCF